MTTTQSARPSHTHAQVTAAYARISQLRAGMWDPSNPTRVADLHEVHELKRYIADAKAAEVTDEPVAATSAAATAYPEYRITPIASRTVFGETDARFVCLECDHSEFLVNGYFRDAYRYAHNHYDGACPARRWV